MDSKKKINFYVINFFLSEYIEYIKNMKIMNVFYIKIIFHCIIWYKKYSLYKY